MPSLLKEIGTISSVFARITETVLVNGASSRGQGRASRTDLGTAIRVEIGAIELKKWDWETLLQGV